MNRNERVLLLAWFAVVLVYLVVSVSAVFALLGIAAGAFLGVPVARTRALRRGPGGNDLATVGGVRLQRVGTTLAAHLATVALFVLVAALVPGLRDRFVALCVGGVTAFAATVVGERLRRG